MAVVALSNKGFSQTSVTNLIGSVSDAITFGRSDIQNHTGAGTGIENAAYGTILRDFPGGFIDSVSALISFFGTYTFNAISGIYDESGLLLASSEETTFTDLTAEFNDWDFVATTTFSMNGVYIPPGNIYIVTYLPSIPGDTFFLAQTEITTITSEKELYVARTYDGTMPNAITPFVYNGSPIPWRYTYQWLSYRRNSSLDNKNTTQITPTNQTTTASGIINSTTASTGVTNL